MIKSEMTTRTCFDSRCEVCHPNRNHGIRRGFKVNQIIHKEVNKMSKEERYEKIKDVAERQMEDTRVHS